ncbi:hypothetical protein AMATHDRAFT_55202 [Amanita thiersii Skay4041]|uniref:Cytochrome P450 n=1 Tax=Amanita thiersii Skay4041 TaxID=703135 RepID=A0A2A9NQS6_9AGAR|nr:hypothetical protein AMATHDRAFT_55202 [Amanita thiersii Skay4041]
MMAPMLALRDLLLFHGTATYWLLLITITLAIRAWKTAPKGKLPPGPRGIPIIGNLHQIPKRPWFQFKEWTKQYGPIFYLNIAGQRTLVLGSHKVTGDLLDRRANIYSDRPKLIVSRILTGGLSMAFSQHNEIWRRMRRASHEALYNRKAQNYHRIQEKESTLLVYHLLTDPKHFDNHIRRTSASLMVSIIYGVPPITNPLNPVVVRINKYTERALAAATPGAYMVEYFPWMQFLPRWMSPWRRYAEDWFKKDSVVFEDFFHAVEKRLEEGDTTYSIASTLLQEETRRNLTANEAAWLCSTMYSAGSETTSSQMAWFLLAMVTHPEVQKKAQEELDHVVGRNRLPTFNDYEQLPYIRALVKEVPRWRGVGPIGVPHRLCCDDVYDGHFLPADTVCIVNVWALNHDPKMYGEDAEEFKPERHLNEHGNIQPSKFPETHDEGHLTYGFGRRICVGRHVSNNSMFMEMACILWAFDISPGKNEYGEIVKPNPDDAHVEGLVVRPSPFPAIIKPRFTEVKAIIANTMDLHNLSDTANLF